MSKDRDDHLYTVGILIIAIALMMFIENKSSCSFPAVQTMLGLLSGLTVYHANFLGLHFFLGDGFFARGIDRNLIRVKK